jgi:hypothetical protein
MAVISLPDQPNAEAAKKMNGAWFASAAIIGSDCVPIGCMKSWSLRLGSIPVLRSTKVLIRKEFC